MNNKVNIAIPTYNRSKSLRRTLLFLNASLEGMDNIYINVIDNCSTDNTKHILTFMEDYFQGSSLNFSYNVNDRNIGLDGSIMFIARNILSSKGFTWFLSDDDYLLSDGVRLFVEILSTSNKKMEIANFLNPQYKELQFDSLLRASFLPSVALKSDFKPVAGIDSLQGYGYIHLAVINTIIENKSEIGVSEFIVGIQMPNISSRFKYFNTLILGYSKCLMFDNKCMSRKDACKEAINRAQSNSALALLDYATDSKLVDWTPTFGDVLEVYREFGIRSYKIIAIILLMKVPRLIIKLVFNKKIGQHLKDMSDKKEIIKEYG